MSKLQRRISGRRGSCLMSQKAKTVTQELDLWWGFVAAEYFSGDMKDAKMLYQTLKKSYP